MEISVSRPMPDDGNCQVIEHLEARPLRARRGWSVEAKARLVEETLVPGANVSAIGRFDYRRLHVLLPGQPQEALPALPGSGADGPEQYRQKKAVWEASSADVTVNW